MTFEVMVRKVYLREGGNGGGGIAYKSESMYHAFDVGTCAMIESGTVGTHLVARHISDKFRCFWKEINWAE